MHFLSFSFDSILCMFGIGELFVIRRQRYMQRLVCIMHSYRVAANTVKMELVYGYIVDLYLYLLIYNYIGWKSTVKSSN
jgi:hypothetical protein